MATDGRGRGGFTGGRFGDGPASRRLTWKSTEQNTDAYALFVWLARKDGPGPWAAAAAAARRFLDSQWDPETGRFFIGTDPDGVTIDRDRTGLDAELWPTLLPGAPKTWRRALTYVRTAFAAEGGFDFNTDRDGMWTEGTAQAALAFARAGDTALSRRLLATVAAQTSPGGYLWATPQSRITTGLAIGPDSRHADFYYFHRPHLAATAWAALAARAVNPFEFGTSRPRRE
jgi:plasmid stabilization system protein ParE